MKEWVITREVDMEGLASCNWELKSGDIDLSLQLRSQDWFRPPYYEMARFISDPLIVKSLVETTRDRRIAWRSIRREGRYVDVYWYGYSNEDLERYCRESKFPLPKDYQKKWDFAMTKCDEAE